ncbi:MAG: ShlB/FhaC/HecB family hemolysin secretion/activation protein [Verrucomicrobiae bacterium]|nr:ShlB/FhaC/HecB family hemolysin secretion/activation protein [Verrucomicrobiae bacterium]
MIDALPPDQQAQVFETQMSLESGQGQGPLRVNTDGQFFLDPGMASGGLSEEILVDYLRGVVVVPRPGDVRAEGWPGIEGIWHDFPDFPEKVGDTLNSFIGTPVSLASLDLMVREVIKAYRTSGRPVVDVLLPEQDITSGVVQLVVIEGELSRIRVEGVDASYEDYLRRQMTIKKGEPIRSNDIQRDLNWLNRSPYRKVDLIYAPGLNFGTTDIILRTVTSNPFWYYLGYENSGTELLGEDRFLFGFNWGDAFGPDQGISYQFTSDFEFDTVRAHSLVFQGGLPWRHWLTILGSYVTVDAEIPVEGADPVLVGGRNLQFSPRYAIPLNAPAGQVREIEFGFDYKSSNNDLEFGGQSVFDTTTEIFQFSAGYDITVTDGTGISRVDLQGFYSPGEWTNQNSDAVFDQARAGSSSDYLYANLGVERQQRLPEGWSLRARGQGQISNGNLQASEQIGAGGYDTVRGYEQRVIRGDEGFWGSLEVYTPPISLGRIAQWENETDELRFLAFYDQAILTNVDRLPDEPNQQELQSVGLGLRWRYSDWFRLRLDYGLPVGDNNVDGIDTNGRLHIGATANF